jgi:radical SAM-linked protein
VVQRLRVRYAKRGRLRFTSHRDFARAFERALRRGGVPVAHSAGFSPHPKVSYLGAAPTGVASEAEYLEIGLARRCDPAAVAAALDAALPEGLDVVAVVEASGAGLAERIVASWWELSLPGVSVDSATAAVEALLAADQAPVERTTKDGRRVVDARAVIALLQVRGAADGSAPTGSDCPPPRETPTGASTDGDDHDGDCAIIDLVARHVTPAVRPDDVLTALRRVGHLSTPVTPIVTRLAQGRLVAPPRTAGAPVDPSTWLADPFDGDAVEHAEPEAATAEASGDLPASAGIGFGP